MTRIISNLINMLSLNSNLGHATSWKLLRKVCLLFGSYKISEISLRSCVQRCLVYTQKKKDQHLKFTWNFNLTTLTRSKILQYFLLASEAVTLIDTDYKNKRKVLRVSQNLTHISFFSFVKPTTIILCITR